MLKKSKGFTNVEMILVVGIISILSTVVYFIYDNASDKRQVSSEINNISGLINKIVSATTATDYKGLSNQALRDMGIYYQSEFKDFEVKGLSPKSFQVTYSLLNSRACSDLSMKTASMKGEYKLTRKINGADAGFNPVAIANACNTQQNKLELVFDGLNIQNIASVTPGTPKPPPNYAGEGTFTPDLPDRGDVPTNLAEASKNTNNPSKPIPGLYKPPEYVVATLPTPPSGNASNPGGITVRPQYPDNKPLGPLVTPPDNGNEWVPAVPPIPPRPPALGPVEYSKTIYIGDIPRYVQVEKSMFTRAIDCKIVMLDKQKGYLTGLTANSACRGLGGNWFDKNFGYIYSPVLGMHYDQNGYAYNIITLSTFQNLEYVGSWILERGS